MKVQVTVNNVKIIEPSILNENEYNIHECEFEFVEEYNGLSKKAIFTNEAGADYIVSIVGDKCSIPSEVLKEKEFVKLGVYAYDVENEELVLRYSPKPTEFYVQEGSYKNAGGTPPTPSEIEQLQAQITHNRNDIEDIQDNIVEINEQQEIQDETIQNNTEAIGTINENIGDLQEEQVEQNRNIQANADDIEDIKQEQIAQNINIQKNTDDIVNINQAIDAINIDITDIDSAIGNINEDIDNLEQDLTNYSLITETGSQINLNVNSTNYQITAILKDKNGNVIYTSNAIDLPIESMIVNARYDNTTKEIILTLQNGDTLRISVADLISGLVSETQLQTILANYYTKTEVDNLLSEKANQSSLDTTNQNLSNLAERVSTNEEDIADIKEEQTTQNTNIEELQSQVETLQEDLESTNAEIEELNTDITNMRKAMITVDGQGSDITLENTSENKFVKFGLEGRTEQEQLTGKNIVRSFKQVTGNFFEYYINANFLTNNMIFSGIINANRISTVYVKAGTLTYSMGTINFTENQLSQGNMTLTNEQIELIQQGTGNAYIQVYANNGDFTSLNIQDIMLKNSSITDASYEPYCGGIPSPNPDYPQQIKNVTGNSNVKIQNKNLFDKNNFEYVNGKRLDDNGEVVSDANSSYSITLFEVKPNTAYTIQGTQSEGTKTTRIYYYNNQKQFISRTRPFGTDSYSFTTLENCYYIGLQLRNSEYINVNIIQLEEGSTATSYVEHQEQNLPFTFASGQFLADNGELKDSGIYNEFQKIIFDGTENILVYESGDNYDGFAIKIKNTYLANAGERSTQKYNYFMELGHSASYGRQPNKATMGTDGYLYVFFEKNVVADVTAVRNWLATKYANGNPLIAIGKVENPISIPYNSTQQAQYEAIKNARSYADKTIITSTSDELGFDMNVVAVADANKVIDSLDTRLSALEGNTNQSKSLNVSADTKNITKETAEDTAENAESSAESEAKK